MKPQFRPRTYLFGATANGCSWRTMRRLWQDRRRQPSNRTDLSCLPQCRRNWSSRNWLAVFRVSLAFEQRVSVNCTQGHSVWYPVADSSRHSRQDTYTRSKLPLAGQSDGHDGSSGFCSDPVRQVNDSSERQDGPSDVHASRGTENG